MSSNADMLLYGLAPGDMNAKPVDPPGLRREQDSLDDFEHLDEESTRREDFNISPLHQAGARAATQNFLDTEREELFVQPPRVPAPTTENLTEKIIDHIADKFTDSESDASIGESPVHRAAPKAEPKLPPVTEAPKPSTPEPLAPVADPTPVLAPTSMPEPKPVAEPKQASEPPKHAAEPKSVAEPKPVAESKPALEPVTTVPKPDSAPVRKEEPLAPPKPAPPKAEPSPPPAAPTAHVIEAEVIFCQMGLDAWFDPQRLHPKVESLIYWRDPARSGAALAAGLALLVALACCSVVSVFAYVSLLGLSGAVAFRIYKNVLQAVQKTNEGHPFKWMLEKDISVPAERAQSLAAGATAHLNATTNELRRLFLVEDLVDSLKFGVVLWCLTYVGAYFNGITLIILGWIALFSLPKAYEMNKAQVDANLELARGKINEISAKVRAAVPLGKKSESEKDK